MLLDKLIGPVTALLDKFIQDKDQKAEIAYKLATLAQDQAHEIAVEQIKTNREEAATGNLFIGGWRPCVAWVCVAAFALNFLINPLANWALVLSGETMVLPTLDTDALMPLLLGMLGLGTLRTTEKVKGVAK